MLKNALMFKALGKAGVDLNFYVFFRDIENFILPLLLYEGT